VSIIVCGADSLSDISGLVAAQTQHSYRIALFFW
jgi:hypothetical protein